MLVGLTKGDRWDLPHNWMKMLMSAIIQIFVKMTFLYLLWVELCACAVALMWQLEDSLPKWVLSFHCVGPRGLDPSSRAW